jgi:hypothetical protein
MSFQMTYLGRYLLNNSWISQYPTSHANSYPRVCSDHSPICLDFGSTIKFKNSIFRFEKY